MPKTDLKILGLSHFIHDAINSFTFYNSTNIYNSIDWIYNTLLK